MPVLGAAAAILDAGGHVLLVRENYDRRRWGFPGGAVEPDESPLDAVVRETREETLLDVRIDDLVGLYRFLHGGLTVHVFRCRIVRGEPHAPASGEIAEVGWFSPDALPQPRTNILHHALPDVLAGGRGVVRDRLARLT
jgi:ADP-ribose pyrophosphatase YjhB (NUDIX family)